MKLDKILVGVALAALSVPLLAQVAPSPPVPPAPPMAPRAPMAPMAPMTRAEVQARVAEHFARLDTNHDGVIAGDELKAGPMGGDRIKRVEIRRERMADPNAAFDRLDTDRNGSISRDEFARGREMRIEQRVERMAPDGKVPGAMRMDHGGPGGGMAMMRGPMILKMADTNRDGRITLQEATTATLQHFDMADANRDGRLTPEEMRAAHERMRAMHMPKAS